MSASANLLNVLPQFLMDDNAFWLLCVCNTLWALAVAIVLIMIPGSPGSPMWSSSAESSTCSEERENRWQFLAAQQAAFDAENAETIERNDLVHFRSEHIAGTITERILDYVGPVHPCVRQPLGQKISLWFATTIICEWEFKDNNVREWVRKRNLTVRTPDRALRRRLDISPQSGALLIAPTALLTHDSDSVLATDFELTWRMFYLAYGWDPMPSIMDNYEPALEYRSSEQKAAWRMLQRHWRAGEGRYYDRPPDIATMDLH